MAQSGLAGTTLFTTEQLPNACGYLAAYWACKVRELEQHFTAMTLDQARAKNNAGDIEVANVILNVMSQSDAVWLSGDQIHAIATAFNPDGIGADPSWLHGPGPFNMWRTHFLNSLTSAQHQGHVHIWVVNTESQHNLYEPVSGAHWFLAAWLVEPDNAEA